MTRTVLLRISDDGSPLPVSSDTNGVFTLPSAPLDSNHRKGDVIYDLVFQINAAAPILRDGIIWTNVPLDPTLEFKRQSFSRHVLVNSFYKDTLVTLPIYKPGSYCYYVSFKNKEGQLSTTRKFYFNVAPNLYLNSKYIPLNSINLQSVISKWIGPLHKWDAIFNEISKKGYNMVHFTPLQERGISNSPYSIYDQLKFDSHLFGSNEESKVVLNTIREKHSLLLLTDVVWNHTANNSSWLLEHPDAGYNSETAPHLIPAIELDKKLLGFSKNLKELGFVQDLKTAEDLLSIMEGIKVHVIAELKLWEYYILDLPSILSDLRKYWEDDSLRNKIDPIIVPGAYKNNIKSLADFVIEKTKIKNFGLGDRFSNDINRFKLIEILASYIPGDSGFDIVKQEATNIINEINLPLYKEYDSDLNEILEQLYNRIKYLRIDENGPKLGEITDDNPLTEPYFTRFEDKKGKQWALANNGWIWNSDPLVDFASSRSKAYLRREIIIWGDCVKLRYGQGPEESPYLWNRMIDYTKLCASVFDGFRIDNCHSTPLHVGEHLLDVARSINPNLYVVAELFSGSEKMDRIFVERLGINSLLREAMQAWSEEELSALAHKNGGRPIGSLNWLPMDEFAYPAKNEPLIDRYFDSSTEIEIPRVLSNQRPHALFMDCTHDNEMPSQKRTTEDTLPNAAIVAFCACAIGSVFGYDECYPHLLDVVSEKRTYSYGKGIGEVKAKLYNCRRIMASQSIYHLEYDEIHVHHENQFITIQRTNTKTGKGFFLIARTKFSDKSNQTLRPITLSGTKLKLEFAYSLKKTGEYKHDGATLTGVPVQAEKIEPISIDFNFDKCESVINLVADFPQGSIAVLSTEMPYVTENLDAYIKKGALEASKELNLYDLNALLYKCESEERDASYGKDGVYIVPGYGSLSYAGLQGWVTPLKSVVWENDLAHPIMEHLRQGEWALDYIITRLNKYAETSNSIKAFREWMVSRFSAIRDVPYFLRPRYFALIVGVSYEACRFRALFQFSDNIRESTKFVQALALTSVQMVGFMKSTSLNFKTVLPSMAAGLPHFSYDYMRCWGRDVFIAFRGLLLVTGRYDDAKSHILCFAQTLKHGLIPNLLDAGRNPRYNARDAAWFFIQGIQDYVNFVPEGEKILEEKVKRRFPLDDTYIKFDDEQAFSYETTIRGIIYEILSRHAWGIKYREANAGPTLDSQMTDEGFNVEINVDWKTGFIYGGSPYNCGTWMDKMGESEKAHSKGIPGTPRNGAAIELSGLLKSALRFVNDLNSKGLFNYTDVSRADGSRISLKEWEGTISRNFERCYYVPEHETDDADFDVDPSIVNRRGIYKDLYKSSKPFEDYQLRPNFSIAMVVAPELFTNSRALKAIQIADEVIRGPNGMRTLDPSDLNYRPYYNNGEDSTDFATSKGRNYHQGPEWVWCLGFFLRAFYKFHCLESPSGRGANSKPSHELLELLRERLEGNMQWIKESPWAGLTELTNKDGEFCNDSSPTQAWSSSCLLDLYSDIWTDIN